MTTLFLLMLCNDREILGPWTNPPWLKALASVIVAVLILLSMILTITTLFPSIDVATVFVVGAIALGAGLLALGAASLRSSRVGGKVIVVEETPQVPKAYWTMPPSTLLSRPRWSAGRHAAMLALGSYMVVALVLLAVKSVQLAGG
jgi:hypothetical protein